MWRCAIPNKTESSPRKTTRKAQGSGTLRKRANGTWEARFTVGRDPGTGKQIQKSVYGKTQAEVRKKMQQAIVAVDEGAYFEPSRLTVGQWFDVWIRDFCNHLKPSTINLYEIEIRKHIRPKLGATKLAALTTPVIQSFCNGLQSGARPLSAKTIKNIHGIVHKCLQQAVELNYLRFNPSSACKLPRIEKKEMYPLIDDAIPAFLQAIQGHRFEYLFIFDLFTGVRQGEVLGLTWQNVNFDEGTALISKQLQKLHGINRLVALKNDKERKLKLAPTVLQVLRQQKRAQAGWRLRAGAVWENEFNLVFTNEIGKPLVRNTVYNNLKRVVASIELPETRFHDLRHSYAVLSLQAGDDVKTVQENLGHHTAAFTLDVYGHVSEKMKEESANRLEQFIKNSTNL